ncbi:hypothetical protein IMSAGC008_02389 [Muribaculaceae bacterium]|nr:hypothetical protein IMSAGC008_02389 [Muribaculaceae bacterium]
MFRIFLFCDRCENHILTIVAVLLFKFQTLLVELGIDEVYIGTGFLSSFQFGCTSSL